MPVRQVIVRNPLRKLVSPPTVFPGYQRKWAGSLTAGVGIPQLVVSWLSAIPAGVFLEMSRC